MYTVWSMSVPANITPCLTVVAPRPQPIQPGCQTDCFACFLCFLSFPPSPLQHGRYSPPHFWFQSFGKNYFSLEAAIVPASTTVCHFGRDSGHVSHPTCDSLWEFSSCRCDFQSNMSFKIVLGLLASRRFRWKHRC